MRSHAKESPPWTSCRRAFLGRRQRMRIASPAWPHGLPPAHVVIADNGDANGADQQQHRLEALRPDHRQQAADHRINAGQHAQHDDEEHQGVDAAGWWPSTSMPKMPRSTTAAVYRATPMWITIAEISDTTQSSRGNGDCSGVPGSPAAWAPATAGTAGQEQARAGSA